jgi:tetratricopeptide (TPR) repeat protein
MAAEMVGRDDELAVLESFVRAVPEGQSALVLDGAAGIGKTTLWLAGVELARDAGLHVLTATPSEVERELANVVLGDLLAESLDPVLPRLPTPRRRALEAALLLDSGDGHAAGPRELGVAVHSALRLLAEAGPVVIAVDDCQWLDASSADALAFALRRLSDETVALLLARRAGAEVPAGVDNALAADSVTTLPVVPLTLGATQALVQSRLGRSFPRPQLVRLHEVSGGNPFYALELARALDAAAAEPGAPLPMPESLEALVGGRIRALPERTRAALVVLAALGRATRTEVEAAGVVLEGFAPAIDAYVVEADDDELRFTHPLLAAAAYALAPLEERRRVHERLADVAVDPVSRARHLALVLDAPDPDAAVTLEAAASAARARGAAGVAAELGEAAARATPADQGDGARRRTAQAARDHFAAGGVERAFALGRELVETSTSGADRAEALLLLAEFEEWAGDLTRAAVNLRDVLDTADAGPRTRAAAHRNLAMAVWLTGSVEEAEKHAREALRRAEELAHDVLTCIALGVFARIRFARGEPDSLRLATRVVEAVARLDRADQAGDALVAVGHILAWLGRIDDARHLFTERLASVADRDERAAAEVHFYLSLVEARAGRLDLARRHADRQRGIHIEYLPAELADEPAVAVAVAHVAALQGDYELARELARRSLACAGAGWEQSQPRFLVALLGMLDHWTGNSAGAVERFEAIERARRSAGRSHATSLHVADYVEALLALGRLTDAATVLEDWDAGAQKLQHVWAGPQIVRSSGLVAAARGEVEEALGLLEQAVSGHESIGDPFGRGRALLALGVTRRRARQKRAAREAIEAALAGFARRAQSRRAGRRGADEPRDRRRALPRRAHGRDAPVARLREAGDPLAYGARAHAGLSKVPGSPRFLGGSPLLASPACRATSSRPISPGATPESV